MNSLPHSCSNCGAAMTSRGSLEAEVERLQKEVKYRDDIIGLSPDGDRHGHLVDEIERLRAIVDKLPKTADGVAIVDGMTVYREPNPQYSLSVWSAHVKFLPSAGIADVDIDPTECYSTRAAAEAAKKKGTDAWS